VRPSRIARETSADVWKVTEEQSLETLKSDTTVSGRLDGTMSCENFPGSRTVEDAFRASDSAIGSVEARSRDVGTRPSMTCMTCSSLEGFAAQQQATRQPSSARSGEGEGAGSAEATGANSKIMMIHMIA
jgi:hypothetical protein